MSLPRRPMSSRCATCQFGLSFIRSPPYSACRFECRSYRRLGERLEPALLAGGRQVLREPLADLESPPSGSARAWASVRECHPTVLARSGMALAHEDFRALVSNGPRSPKPYVGLPPALAIRVTREETRCRLPGA